MQRDGRKIAKKIQNFNARVRLIFLKTEEEEEEEEIHHHL